MDEEKDGSQMLVVARYNLSNFGAQLPKATTETFALHGSSLVHMQMVHTAMSNASSMIVIA